MSPKAPPNPITPHKHAHNLVPPSTCPSTHRHSSLPPLTHPHLSLCVQHPLLYTHTHTPKHVSLSIHTHTHLSLCVFLSFFIPHPSLSIHTHTLTCLFLHIHTPISLPKSPYYRTVCVLSHVQLFSSPWTQPTRLLWAWDFPGKNTGVGCHFLL